jgi:hypothetical protein
MRRRWFLVGTAGALAALSVLAVAAPAWAGGPGKWTQLGVSDNGADTFGMVRTADNNLHLVWLAKRASDTTQSYDWATVSEAGGVLGTGTLLSGWATLEPDPRLVPDGSAIRLIFNGNTGPSSGCYQRGEIFTATSTDGSTWNLVNGSSMDLATVGVGNIAATDEADGTTPVAVFSGGHKFHVGVDPNCPALSADGTITPTTGSNMGNPAAVTDTKTGAVYVAWFQSGVTPAWSYWVEQILPTQGPPIEAPDSTGPPGENNQPDEPVALAAGAGGGEYMAYCVADNSEPCTHIDLWKVGSPKPMVVPGSENLTGARVALAADPPGNMSVAWFHSANGHNVIDAVRTNSAVTSWGALTSTNAPNNISTFSNLQANGSSIRLDLLATITLGTPGFPVGLFQTQLLPGLTLTASPLSFSHKKSAKVAFTVTDAGRPISGAVVSCLGKTGTSGSSGTVKLKFGKGEPKGKHLCTAQRAGYAHGRVKIKVK